MWMFFFHMTSFSLSISISWFLPHRRLSSVVWAAQHDAFHSGSFHRGRSRSNPPAVHYMWSRQSMRGASITQGLPLKQTLPFLHRRCFRHTVICRHGWLKHPEMAAKMCFSCATKTDYMNPSYMITVRQRFDFKFKFLLNKLLYLWRVNMSHLCVPSQLGSPNYGHIGSSIIIIKWKPFYELFQTTHRRNLFSSTWLDIIPEYTGWERKKDTLDTPEVCPT